MLGVEVGYFGSQTRVEIPADEGCKLGLEGVQKKFKLACGIYFKDVSFG